MCWVRGTTERDDQIGAVDSFHLLSSSVPLWRLGHSLFDLDCAHKGRWLGCGETSALDSLTSTMFGRETTSGCRASPMPGEALSVLGGAKIPHLS